MAIQNVTNLQDLLAFGNPVCIPQDKYLSFCIENSQSLQNIDLLPVQNIRKTNNFNLSDFEFTIQI